LLYENKIASVEPDAFMGLNKWVKRQNNPRPKLYYEAEPHFDWLVTAGTHEPVSHF
jgi:hypothetical protein